MKIFCTYLLVLGLISGLRADGSNEKLVKNVVSAVRSTTLTSNNNKKTGFYFANCQPLNLFFDIFLHRCEVIYPQ